MNDPADKFQLLTAVPLPAYCVACRMGSDGQNQFVDLTMDLDYYGAVLLCRNCAEEIARLVGFESTAIIGDTLTNHADLLMQLAVFEEKVKVLEDVVFTYGISSDSVTDEFTADVETDSSEKSGKFTTDEAKFRLTKQTTGK